MTGKAIAIIRLNELLAKVDDLPKLKGKAAVRRNIRTSIRFVQMHKTVNEGLLEMIVREREVEIERIGKGEEYKQAEIDWRMSNI